MLTELKETVELLQDSSKPLVQQVGAGEAYELGAAVRVMLDGWGRRVPSTSHQDMSVWDDLLCCRRRLLTTLEKRLDEEIGAKVFEEEQQDALRKRFGEARHGCLLALLERSAQAAREQCNYDAAQMYLKAAKEPRRALGARQGLEGKVEVLRLMLERDRARRDALGELEWEKSVRLVHENLQALAGNAAGAPAADRAVLAALSAAATWELVEVQKVAHPSSVPALIDGACATMRSAVGAAEEAHAMGQMAPERVAAARLQLADCCESAAARLGQGEQLTATAIEQVFKAMNDDHTCAAARNRLVSALAAARDYPALWTQVAQWALLPPRWSSLGWVGQLVAMLGEAHGGLQAG